MSGNNTKKTDHLPKLTPEQTRELELLEAKPDYAIDFSDIPELTEEDFGQAIRLNGRPMEEVLRLYRARKAPVTARIDLDVLTWLKSKGSGYQTRMNQILRDAMVKELSGGKPKK